MKLRRKKEETGREIHAKRQGSDEKDRRLGDHDADGGVRKRAAEIRGCHEAAHDGQDDQSFDVIDDRGAHDDARFSRLRPAEILHDAGRNPDARRRQRRAQEDMRVHAGRRDQPGADSPAKNKWTDDAHRRDQERGQANLQHLGDRRFEADLKQQQDDAKLRQHLDRLVGLRDTRTSGTRPARGCQARPRRPVRPGRRAGDIGRPRVRRASRRPEWLRGKRGESEGTRDPRSIVLWPAVGRQRGRSLIGSARTFQSPDG